MSWFQLIIELTALTLGGSYLWFKHGQRVRNCTPREDPEKWTGHGIEASELKTRIEQARQNYLDARQATCGILFHRYLLVLARRAVTQVGYFRYREAKAKMRTTMAPNHRSAPSPAIKSGLQIECHRRGVGDPDRYGSMTPLP